MTHLSSYTTGWLRKQKEISEVERRKDYMKTFKRIIAALLLAALPAAAISDTPLVQALKVEQKIKDVMEALHDVNADV